MRGGERCFACYELRLRKDGTAYTQIWVQIIYDYADDQSILKNAAKLNEIGEKIILVNTIYHGLYRFQEKEWI